MVANGFHSFDWEHPHLGHLVGLQRSEHTIQFRTITYGQIPARFRQAHLVERLSPKQRVCTDYTYACPQHEQSMDAFGGPLHTEARRRYDEFECLNLTVTAPVAVLKGRHQRRLPVMVYVHGGGFVEGAHYGAVHDMTKLVDMSCRMGKPVIIVSIHYRLHFLGFLASQDLLAEARSHDEPPGNQALHDQRLAFQWVQRFISGFGGDPRRVTAIGESAGSASLAFHMSSTVPLFSRVILQSGTAATISPTPLADKEAEYQALLQYCGIGGDDPDRLEKLRAVPVEKLVGAVGILTRGAFSPLAHESFFPLMPNFRNHTRILMDCPWVDTVVLGDCVFEGYLFFAALQDVAPEKFCQHVEDILGTDRAKRALDLYDISQHMDRNLFWTRLCVFTGDIMFSLPNHNLATALATHSTKQCYRYTLSLRNPFPGSPFTGILGHHFMELLYQFQTLNHRFPLQVQRNVAEGFADRWLAAVNGEAPWAAHRSQREDGEEGALMIEVADERSGWVTRNRREDEKASGAEGMGVRRYAAWEGLNQVFAELDDEQAVEAVRRLGFPVLAALAAEG